MPIFRLVVFAALMLAPPAFGQTWRVEDVSGDAVGVAPHSEAEPLEKGDLVSDGAMLVSGPATTIRLTRDGDALVVRANAVVDLRQEAGARAVVEPSVGRLELKTLANPEGALRASTRFFKIDAQAASFTLDVRKDSATVDVLSGEVRVQDLTHGGRVFVLRAGGEFRAAPAKGAPAKASEEEAVRNADAQAQAAMKSLETYAGHSGGKLTKDEKRKRNALMRALAAKGLSATRQGLQEMGEDYEGDPPVEVPRTGILNFLFGPGSPGVGYVLAGLAATFLLVGALTAAALGATAFGALGNALVLLSGASLGAALHDFAFPPETFWAYEPTPGVVTTTLAAAAALAAACILRRILADRWVEAEARNLAKIAARAPHETFG